jgi:hypothetical protein
MQHSCALYITNEAASAKQVETCVSLLAFLVGVLQFLAFGVQ